MPASDNAFQPSALLRRLTEAEIDFVVVGGVAMRLHGSGRNTEDLDICYATDAENLDALGGVLTDLGATLFGLPPDFPFIPDGATLRRTVILTLDSPLGKIDLLVEPAGAPRYVLLKQRAREATLGGLRFKVASLDDLESMKRAAGRPKDLIDLEEIEIIRALTAERDQRAGQNRG